MGLDISILEDQSSALDILDAAGFNFENPDAYPESGGAKLPATGNYAAKVEKYDFARNKAKEPIFDAGPLGPKTFPIITIQSIRIVEGLGEGVTPKVGLLQQVRTKTFPRDGGTGSEAQDWLRAFDATRSSNRTPNEQVALLDQFIKEGLIFRARFDWFAEDWEGRQAEFDRLGHDPKNGKNRLTPEQVKNIYNKFRVTSMSKFPKRYGPDGTTVIGYDQIWKSPTGKPIEARLKAVRLYKSLDQVVLGPAGN